MRLRRDRLILESCPLHTEEPQWAAHAPAQVAAACKRGAHVIGLTETRGPVMDQVRAVVADHGYRWIGSPLDSHRNVTLLVRRGLAIIERPRPVLVANNYRPAVVLDFYGRRVTVFGMHWETREPARATQTASLIKAMDAAGFSFYLADSNPSAAQHLPWSQPGADLLAAGAPTIFQELHHWPPSIGVTVVGRNANARRAKALSATVHDPLGSDHVPVTAVYGIRRPLKGI